MESIIVIKNAAIRVDPKLSILKSSINLSVTHSITLLQKINRGTIHRQYFEWQSLDMYISSFELLKDKTQYL